MDENNDLSNATHRSDRERMQLKINFQLQELNKIAPFGSQQDFTLHWFALTDGLLWINVGPHTLYEYTEAAQNYFSTPTPYNDYQIVRFLEDFFVTFRYVGESIPEVLYNSIDRFEAKADKWKNYHIEDEDDLFDEFYDNEYSKLVEWYWDRIFDSGHLVGGPHIGCFRYEDKIKMIWNSSFILQNGSSIWVSPKGIFEMPYEEFVLSVTKFLESFFEAMDEQVKKAVVKDWGNIFLDKSRLISEHNERKIHFYQQLSFLKDTQENSEWHEIMKMYNKMEKID